MTEQLLAGRYRLGELLGKGSAGAVWRAEDAESQAAVAVKISHAEAAANPSLRQRLEREASLVEQARCTNIVALLDRGTTDDDRPFYVMEYLEGETLRARLDRRQWLSGAETMAIVDGVCQGLGVAHELGLVHRDLKPLNIFLATDGDTETAKVLDFGVAKVGAPTMIRIEQTRTGVVLGTPRYMSPEQAAGSKDVDYRADLWSLGVVIFECATGVPPFAAEAMGPLIAKIVMGRIPAPSEVAPQRAGPAMDRFFAQALCRDPQGRFASASALAAAWTEAVRSDAP